MCFISDNVDVNDYSYYSDLSSMCMLEIVLGYDFVIIVIAIILLM